MHQRLHRSGHKAVVDDEVLVNVERGVAALQIARAVIGNAVAQGKVLRACRRADRIGLDEAERVERALQGGRREERTRDRGAPEVVEGHSTVIIIPVAAIGPARS